MLSEAKHLVLRTDVCFLPRMKFFVAELILRSPRPKGVGSNADGILRTNIPRGARSVKKNAIHYAPQTGFRFNCH